MEEERKRQNEYDELLKQYIKKIGHMDFILIFSPPDDKIMKELQYCIDNNVKFDFEALYKELPEGALV